ncbi:conserved protein of unknown function [Pseudorhizobium banfieldiae]|uniref:Metal-dependent peptidase n=1 Tax=Pseudorhizobium banfieldiae TaxID=1125847 RepID=L0NEA8_9HYPH|nr:VWA-like domain-containing protein [Pseudorhizobium banfieldiae]CAD6606102.1 peptidase [arsenite-oxidising bacterium NT-25]CCF19131.1 conserved protein of unknown function [Pseudorhizobium banfieldiae]
MAQPKLSPADKMLAAQTSLLWDHPFFGVLNAQLEMIEVEPDHPQIDTMATDGRRLWWNPKFVEDLTVPEVVFVRAHEVMHNALEHHIRRGHRKPGRFNDACDYAINGELVACGVGKMPKIGLIDPRYTGLSAEEIYRLLDDENDGDDSSEGQGDRGGCGTTVDGCPQNDEAAKAELQAEMQTKIRQAAMVAKAAQAGKLPASLSRLIDELLAPKVDWRAVLRRFIDESMTRDFAWHKPNRRMIPHGIITPGLISDGVSHIVIAVDTSGSIDNDILKDFAAEVNGAYQEGAVDKLTVIYADASVARIDQFENGDELTINPAGGGGTAFSDTFEKITDQFPDARACIYLTDMGVYDFGDEPPMPVLWGVYGRSSKDVATLSPPFGECINISI